MANPFGAETHDYGTVSGHSSGFRSDADFISRKERIGNLVLEIKQSTQKLRHEEFKVGTPSDTEEFRGKLQNQLRKTLGKVQTGKSLLVELADQARHSNDRGHSLAVKSLQQSMTTTVNEFQEASQDVLRAMDTAGPPVRARTPQSYSGNFSDAAEVSDQHDRARLVSGEQRASLEQQDQLMISDEASHMEQRAEKMGQIENDILALNDLMGDIGRLVMEQGEQTDHIENQVETAYTEVQRGNEQLEKGVKLKKCSRKLLCIIFTIVGVILAIIIIAIVITVVKVTDHNKGK